ncbi:YlmH/Sll1252 family protein [uncultured Anaerococcus sp.]|uniref:YlmH/Sll1252 family protein n=1 Tax=uncultured Anaerococcus sp. TaxID=293428 RepID=UPI0034299256
MSLTYNLDFITDKNKKSSIKKAISILERSYYKGTEETSFFLDPFEQEVIESIANKNNINITFIGASDLAERKIFIANYYYEPVDESNYISVLEFNHNGLIHPDVLGSLMSLNIDRESIGDIVVDESSCQFAVLNDESAFIKFNLNKIKRQSISIDYKKDNRLDISPDSFVEMKGFVSSLRLDNIVSEFVNISRSKAKDIIKSKNVKVDFEIIENPGKIIKEDSIY